jgi:DNA-binding transcriptional MerR regulator
MTENTEDNFPEKMASDENGNGKLMSIREVSARTGVPPHTLRFWEKEMPNILCPKRTSGGQRRYDSEMTERVRMIKRLSDEKRYSLATIREYLGAEERLSQCRPSSHNRVHAERVVELIVDEITGFLKERLLQLLDTDELRGDGSIDRQEAYPE